MTQLCKRIAESETFQSFILFLIVVTAVSMAVETVPQMSENFSALFGALDVAAQIVFGFEILVRLGSFAPSIGRFFKSGWNVFDFVVVTASFLPVVGSFALVARLLRVLRVLRVISVSDRLRGFMDRLTDSFGEVAAATVIASVLVYIFAISGHYLFHEADPLRWGSLGASALSIFYLLLLQEVPSFVQPLLLANKSAILFFVVFYLAFISLAVSVLVTAIAHNTRGNHD